MIVNQAHITTARQAHNSVIAHCATTTLMQKVRGQGQMCQR